MYSFSKPFFCFSITLLHHASFYLFLFKEETKSMYSWHLRLNAIEKKYKFRKSVFSLLYLSLYLLYLSLYLSLLDFIRFILSNYVFKTSRIVYIFAAKHLYGFAMTLKRKNLLNGSVCVFLPLPAGRDREEIKWDLCSSLALPVSRGTERESSVTSTCSL